MRRALVLLTVVLATPGAVQATEVEITPFAGYRFGGEIKANNSDFFDVDVEVDEDAAFGFALDLKINKGLTVELMASRQDSEFVTDTGLFNPQDPVLDVEVTYYHVGVGWAWKREEYEPFLIGSIGITDLSPNEVTLRDEQEFSASIGGGVKIWVNPHLGFRFEGRGFWTDTDDRDDEWEFWNYDDDLYQGEVKVGLIIAF